MRTAIVILIGLVALGATVELAPVIVHGATRANAAYLFVAAWLVFCIIDWYVGVFRAGYPAMEELRIHAVIFAVPTVAAIVLTWILRR